MYLCKRRMLAIHCLPSFHTCAARFTLAPSVTHSKCLSPFILPSFSVSSVVRIWIGELTGVPRGDLSVDVDPYRLGFGVIVHRFEAHFAPVSGLAEPAERGA